jgi:hypothetical protein
MRVATPDAAGRRKMRSKKCKIAVPERHAAQYSITQFDFSEKSGHGGALLLKKKSLSDSANADKLFGGRIITLFPELF